jgi:purine-nucleoside phosphorylase
MFCPIINNHFIIYFKNAVFFVVLNCTCMENIIGQIEETIAYLHGRSVLRPKLAMVFGSGISSESLLDHIDIRIPYGQIPHFAVSTVKNHKGELIIGTRNGHAVFLFSGRLHYYEGYSAKEITYPVRILKSLGVEQLILTNAAGGVNPDFDAGDIMLISDHINLFPEHPLRGVNNDVLGPRFPDMLHAYDPAFISQIENIGNKLDLPVKKGVYLASQGPSLETPAEYTMMRTLGADAVGMSTVLETIVAIHGGVKVGGFSVISNECFPISRIVETSEQDVVDMVKKSEERLMKLVGAWIDNFYPAN